MITASIIFVAVLCTGVVLQTKYLPADTLSGDGAEFNAGTIRALSAKVATAASESVAGAMGKYLTGKNLEKRRAGAVLRKIRQNQSRITRAAGRGVQSALKGYSKVQNIPPHIRKRYDAFIRKETVVLINDMDDPETLKKVFAGFSQVVDIGTKKQGSANDVIRLRFLDHLNDRVNDLLAPPPPVAVRKVVKKKRVTHRKIRKKKAKRKRRKVTKRVKQRPRARQRRRNTRRRSPFDIGIRAGNFSAGRIQF